MTLTPAQRYQLDIKVHGFVTDDAQQIAVNHLDDLYHKLIEHPAPEQNELATKLRTWFGSQKTHTPITGLYFWGGVGRGKTYLMDMFFECIPGEQKMRIHFHRFMQRVHHQRKALVDASDPMHIIGRKLAKQVRVLCFDEFVVHDVVDAVILAKLLHVLCEQGVCLVATSNVEPTNLYKGGLQRDLFLPAIDLIIQHTKIVNIDSGIDYRLRFLDKAETYFSPLGASAEQGMQYNFSHLACEKEREEASIEIEGRVLQTLKRADGVIWFDFCVLCDSPRSQHDYLEIARCFHSVLLSNVPILDRLKEDQARRFINLVDVLYDHNVKLILSAQTNVENLYQGTKNAFEIQRTISRLQEMQSHDYLALAHKTDCSNKNARSK